jgi:hypothetical protein
LGQALNLPQFYLEDATMAIQDQFPELDVELEREVHELAIVLEGVDPSLWHERDDFKVLASKYRFEKRITWSNPIDYIRCMDRIQIEQQQIKEGKRFSTEKGKMDERVYFPHDEELRDWVSTSIENRILQCDSHHIDARGRAILQPKLFALRDDLEVDLFKMSNADIERKLSE